MENGITANREENGTAPFHTGFEFLFIALRSFICPAYAMDISQLPNCSHMWGVITFSIVKLSFLEGR